MNSINITGRLTADPELKHTQSGVAVTTYTLAVKRPKVKDTTDFLSMVTWRQGADYLCQYGRKGDMVAVTGVLTSRKWQDKDGNNRVSFEVVTDTVELVSCRTNNEAGNNQSNAQATAQDSDWDDIVSDPDDLPF